jgi:hypothetical protein
MFSKNYESKFPHLFQEVTWPWGPTRAIFKLIDKTPPEDQISNVNIVPRNNKGWLTLQLVVHSCFHFRFSEHGIVIRWQINLTARIFHFPNIIAWLVLVRLRLPGSS